MPENGESSKFTFHASSPNSTVMALAKVGNGYSRTITNSSRKLQICSCRCGLFHEVGRSKTTREHQGTNNSEFFWQNIICRFGVPRELTVDNGKQFDSYTFKEYCKSLGTHAKFSSVHHPQSNRAVERANGLIFLGIKKFLFDQKKGKWVDELSKVI
jgi:transposase InsO family protein